ncbi:hypothetical protein WJX77_007822 [Trebouxia sp. C0004]
MPVLKAAEFEAATAEFIHVSTISLQLNSTRPRLGELEPGFAQGVKKIHTPKLSAISYLADKRHLYAGIDTGEVRLWDFSVGARKQAWLLIGSHKGSVTSVLAVTSSSRVNAAAGLVLSGSADATIKVWDVKLRVQETHVCVQTLVGHTGTVSSLVHRGACILSSSTDCTVRIWKAIEGRGMLTYPWFEPQAVLIKMSGWVTCMSYAASARVGDFGTLYAADAAAAIVKINPCIVDGPNVWKETSQIQWKLTGTIKDPKLSTLLAFSRVHDRMVSHIRYLPEEGLIATLAFDNTLCIFNAIQASLRCTVANDTGGPFTGMEHDPVRSQLLVIDKNHLHVWDLARDHFVARKRISQHELLAIFKSSGKGEFGVVSAGAVDIWRVEQDLDYRIVLGGHTEPVIALLAVNGTMGGSETPDYRVLSIGQDDTLRMWDPFDMTCLRVLKETRSELTALTFFAAGNTPITGHDDGSIRLWNLETGTAVDLMHHTNSVTCLVMAQVSHLDQLLFSAGFDGCVCVWDVRIGASTTPHLTHHWHAHPGSEILTILHDPMKNVIITAGNDSVIKVWNARLYEQLGKHTGHVASVTCLALDGNFLISGSDDCTVRLWDLVPASRDGNMRPAAPFQGSALLRTLRGHKAPLRGLVVLPEAGHVASASSDGRLLLWDYSQGAVLRRFHHVEEFSCLACRHDVNEIIVGTMQNSILRFPIDDGDLDRSIVP